MKMYVCLVKSLNINTLNNIIASEEAKAIIQAVCDGDPEIHEGNEMGYNAVPRKNTNKKEVCVTQNMDDSIIHWN